MSLARIPIKLLTAKPELVRMEAQIVAAAGMPGSITLATNMAGDIAPKHKDLT